MSSVRTVNPNAEVVARSQALLVNVSAAKGLQGVLKSNLGPRGTLKMLVGGAGQIKLTKDGNVLLHEMQIQHPTAAVIARAATAQDDITGDGTTSTVLFTGELLKQAERFLADGLHPRILVEGFELAREEALRVLDQVKVLCIRFKLEEAYKRTGFYLYEGQAKFLLFDFYCRVFALTISCLGRNEERSTRS
jgi:T-complex protein 1 subunit zeta